MCTSILSVYHVYAWCSQMLEGIQVSLKLELETGVSCYVDAEN